MTSLRHLGPERGTDRVPPRPSALAVLPDAIPSSLKARTQWVLWRYDLKNGAYRKVPYQANGRPASSVDATTWNSFEPVWRAYAAGGYDGIGIALDGAVDDKGLTLAAIDIDKVAGDPTREGLAQEVIREVGSYTERSPSGNGYRIFTMAEPAPDATADGFEFYAKRGRYLTVTGHAVEVDHA